VERVLDEHVRPQLAADGGSVEVDDIEVEEERILIMLDYGGACRGCASAGTGTLEYIEKTLQEQLDSSIRVLA
jgi:NifU-like protein